MTYVDRYPDTDGGETEIHAYTSPLSGAPAYVVQYQAADPDIDSETYEAPDEATARQLATWLAAQAEKAAAEEEEDGDDGLDWYEDPY
jgi:hypothetical protein